MSRGSRARGPPRLTWSSTNLPLASSQSNSQSCEHWWRSIFPNLRVTWKKQGHPGLRDGCRCGQNNPSSADCDPLFPEKKGRLSSPPCTFLLNHSASTVLSALPQKK